MEAAIHRYLVVQLLFIFLACNACNKVQLQPTTCLFTKNELFHRYFLKIHVFIFSTFLWCDCDLENTSFSKTTVNSCFWIERRQWIYKILCDSNAEVCLSVFLFLIHKLPRYQFLFNLNFQNIFSSYLRR